MFNSHDFFKKRFSAHLKETGRYTRYMFNEHMGIAMLFFIVALAYYYQQWLTQIPDNFPTALIIGVVLGLLVSYSPVRTLLKEPDLIFLLAAEKKMNAYFRNALIYSFVMQLYLICVMVAAFGPLYFATYPDRDGKVYLLMIAIVLIFEGWNLIANWFMLKVREPGVRRFEWFVRAVFTIAVFYFMVNGDLLLAGIATVLFILVFLYDLHVSRKQAGVAWDLLVERDRNRMQTFYRIANMFTDVPHLKNRIKKRQWLVALVRKVPFAKKHTYDYLYRITFVRSGDYLGMYVRLIVLGGLFIYFVPNVWMKLIFAFLFLYMSCFQLMTLYQHHRTIIWLDLYPVNVEWRRKALLKGLFQLMIIQTILFAFLFLFLNAYLGVAIVLVGGMVFNALFIQGYVRRKLV